MDVPPLWESGVRLFGTMTSPCRICAAAVGQTRGWENPVGAEVAVSWAADPCQNAAPSQPRQSPIVAPAAHWSWQKGRC